MNEDLVDRDQLLEGVPGGVFQLCVRDDDTMRFTYRSQRAHELAHLPPDWTFGINAHPDDRDRLIESVKEAVRTVSPWKFEGRCITASEEVRWIEGVALPTRREDEIVFNGLLLDITERKRAEESLGESNERFRTIFGSINDAIFVHDAATGIILDVNQRACELYGYTREDFLRSDVSAISSGEPPYTQEEALMLIKKAADGEPQLVEWHARDKSGRLFWVEVNLWRATIGGRETVLVVVRDITERKHAEEELRESEARFALAQSVGGIGWFDWNPVDDTIKWSDTLFGLYGVSIDSLPPLFDDWLRMIHPDDREQVVTGIARSLTDSTQLDTQFRVVWSDGTIHWLLVRARTFFDESVKSTRLIGVSTDITEIIELRHKVERQLLMLESALVPAKPSLEGDYRTAVVYLPAHPGEDIGGDFYDVFTTESGQIAVMIGDVAGKGIEAAALAAAARSTIRSFAYDLSSPGAALSHSNAVLQSEADRSERFATAFLAIIDPTTGRLNYAEAGHPPAAIWRTNGRVEFLEGLDPPIGLITRHRYAEFDSQLDPGDKLVLYTDGILEARSGLEILDLEGVGRALAEYGRGTPDEVASGLLAVARDWAYGSLRDDVAIVVVERPD